MFTPPRGYRTCEEMPTGVGADNQASGNGKYYSEIMKENILCFYDGGWDQGKTSR